MVFHSMSARQKRIIVLIVVLIIFSLITPLYYDGKIDAKNDRVSEISQLIIINLNEFSRYHQIMQRHIDFKSTYNILIAFNHINISTVPIDVIEAYRFDKDDALLTAVKKIATLSGATYEEIKSLENMTIQEQIDIRFEYVDNFRDNLNEGMSEIVKLQKSISQLKMQKNIVISIGTILGVIGIALDEKEKVKS